VRAPTAVHDAHELVGWEARVPFQVACFLAVCACTLPLLAGLGLELQPPLHRLQVWFESRVGREATGFVGLGIIAFQVSLGVMRRMFGRGSATHALWRALHQLLPIGLLLIALLHTQGHLGSNLNRWLVGVLLAQIYLVQAGHVAKALLANHGGSLWLSRLDRAANDASGVVHRVGLRLHVLLAVTVVILLAVHVLAAYYF